MKPVHPDEVFGLVRPGVDAHTLGLSHVRELLQECGYRVLLARASVCEALSQPWVPGNVALFLDWLRRHRITRLGFSYRLDPEEGAQLFHQWFHHLRRFRLFQEQGGPLRGIYFAGLPRSCQRVKEEHGDQVEVFYGDETIEETLHKLGIPLHRLPRSWQEGTEYDRMRWEFGRWLCENERHRRIQSVEVPGYEGFGTRQDRLLRRLRHYRERNLLPLMRAHVGPYLPDREQAVALFLDWCRQLARGGFLDILSIGTSQLTQANFGEDWTGKPNGGGVPLNTPEEFRQVWEASRPMLVRTYAGTKNIPWLARMYEETINIAWHALSLWWFCQIDGRGPYPVRKNLEEHWETLRFISASGKPYEPNIPHHFAFRGADDVTYIVSSVLAARAAKRLGVRSLVLQVMLNTPKFTWGVQDLAKARALLHLVRELEDERFRVFLQPRAGLDLFSHDLDKAKAQLAAVSALMDDIEPHDPHSPPIVHVVSYSEGSHLADPPIVEESIQITRAALEEYRRWPAKEELPEASEIRPRTQALLEGAKAVLQAMERAIPDLYSPRGFYLALKAGFLPVPYLWEGREEFHHAVQWRTRFLNGGVEVVDEQGRPIPPAQRAQVAAEVAREMLREEG